MKKTSILENLFLAPIMGPGIALASTIISPVIFMGFTINAIIQSSPMIALNGLIVSSLILGTGLTLGVGGHLIADLRRGNQGMIISALKKKFSRKEIQSQLQPLQPLPPHLSMDALPVEIVADIINKALPSFPSDPPFQLNLVNKTWHHLFYSHLHTQRMQARSKHNFPEKDVSILKANLKQEIAYLITHKASILEQTDEELRLIMQNSFEQLEKVSSERTSSEYAIEAIVDLINENIIYQCIRVKNSEHLIHPYDPVLGKGLVLKNASYNSKDIHIKPFSIKGPYIDCEIRATRRLDCSNHHLTRWPARIILDTSEEMRYFFDTLENIDLSGNYLKALPIAFNKLPKLQQLCVTGNALTDIAEPLYTKFCSVEGAPLSKEEVLELQCLRRSDITKSI